MRKIFMPVETVRFGSGIGRLLRIPAWEIAMRKVSVGTAKPRLDDSPFLAQIEP